MRKYNKWLLRSLLLVCFVMGPGFASSAVNSQKVMDEADILTQEEEEKLQEQLSEIVDAYPYDVAAVTVDTISGEEIQDFAEDYYLGAGYGFGDESDGIMLLISMEERQYYFATFGNATEIFTDYGLEQIDGMVTPDLSDGAYYDAFSRFGSLVQEFIQEGTQEMPYDTNHTYEQEMSTGARLLISFAVGAVIAGLVLFALFSQLKTVGIKSEAQEYVRDGSFHITRQRDVFLYRTVTKIRKEEPKDGGGSTTHTTSAGGRAGGRGGSF